MDKTIRIRILDQEYIIKSPEQEERVLEIARFVDARFRNIQEHADGLSERKTAILAAFHIASEYFQVKEERDGLVRRIENRVRAISSQIDSAIG
ncbi:MAG: cell division protein ZapA [Deltaproteobacteria bacterium]|nr:cell division protein ZapA [Deltaproteobacteria bacterium]MBW1815631.1 cell division protein ZapA [Deltaproteobacteria bacterium]MBW2283071.1 cell division protein ZapA [Deltaproteobacteria bacterium]